MTWAGVPRGESASTFLMFRRSGLKDLGYPTTSFRLLGIWYSLVFEYLEVLGIWYSLVLEYLEVLGIWYSLVLEYLEVLGIWYSVVLEYLKVLGIWYFLILEYLEVLGIWYFLVLEYLEVLGIWYSLVLRVLAKSHGTGGQLSWYSAFVFCDNHCIGMWFDGILKRRGEVE